MWKCRSRALKAQAGAVPGRTDRDALEEERTKCYIRNPLLWVEPHLIRVHTQEEMETILNKVKETRTIQRPTADLNGEQGELGWTADLVKAASGRMG